MFSLFLIGQLVWRLFGGETALEHWDLSSSQWELLTNDQAKLEKKFENKQNETNKQWGQGEWKKKDEPSRREKYTFYMKPSRRRKAVSSRTLVEDKTDEVTDFENFELEETKLIAKK